MRSTQVMIRAVLNNPLEAVPNKTAAVWSLTPDLTNQIRHAGYCWRSKDEFINDLLLWNPTHGHQCWLTSKNLHQLCVNTGCHLEQCFLNYGTCASTQVINYWYAVSFQLYFFLFQSFFYFL